MAFLLHHTKDGSIPPFEWLPTNAADYTIGQAGAWVSGYMTAVSTGVAQDTDAGAHYICMAEKTVATDGDLCPWIRCSPNIVLETTLGVDSASIAAGLKYTIHTDGNSITATTTKGAFEVESFDGKTAGDAVRGILV